MSAIALFAEPGKLVGFLLLANSAAISNAPATSDCIFSGIPSHVPSSQSSLGTFIEENKHKEFQCFVDKSGATIQIKLETAKETEVELQIGETGEGTWSVENSSTKFSGFCEFARKQNG